MKMHSLSVPAEQAIKELRSRGIEPTLDEIITLHDYGRKIERPEPHRSAEGGWPVRCGSVVLHPWTIGAWQWWTRYARPLVGETSDESVLVFAFGMAHARKLDVLYSLVSYDTIRPTVTQWAERLDCTVQEMVSSINALHAHNEGRRKRSEDDSADADLDGLVDWLVSEHGQTREYWMWDATLDYALRLVERYKRQQEGSGKAPDPNDPIIVATGRLRQVVSHIIRSRADG